MKKLGVFMIAVLLIVLSVALVACGDGDNETQHDTPEQCTHNIVVDPGTPATCVAEGYTDGEYCSICNEILKEKSIIPATGHNAGDIVTENFYDATCTDAGSRDNVVYCTTCGIEMSRQSEVVDPYHILEKHEGKEPTCTEYGWQAYETCSRCDYTTYEVIPAGHTYENGVCVDCGKEQPIYTEVDENTILFGEYPQTKVTDNALIATLNSLAGTLPTSSNAQSWTSYQYYLNGLPVDYMWYIDVINGQDKYRGVYFVSFRPDYCETDGYLGYWQEGSRHDVGVVYWYKYEPISWTILKKDNGSALILCDMIIDSQQYDYDSLGAENNYAESTIRRWLNDNFFNTAFSAIEQEKILSTAVDNSLESTGNTRNEYVCDNTVDKVFLLSRAEAKAYFETNNERLKYNTDYALSQGACLYRDGNGIWLLRSPYFEDPNNAYTVAFDGAVDPDYITRTYMGIVPAVWIQI